MPSITIQGSKFEVPEGVLAKYAVGYTIATEGEASALRQTLTENLRNNFAGKVKSVMNGSETLTPEQERQLQAEFDEYAAKYEFGVRSGGGGRQRLDPLTKEMHRIAKEDLILAYKAKFGEAPEKEWVAENLPKLVDKRHDELAKRARANLRQREQAANEALEAVGL